MDESGRPNSETRAAEAEEAAAEHRADRPPTEEEEELAEKAAADRSIVRDPERSGAQMREMAERGAAEPGEGHVP